MIELFHHKLNFVLWAFFFILEILNEKKVRKKLIEYQKFIRNNFEYVGDKFAYEARSIHYNSKKKDLEQIKKQLEKLINKFNIKNK